MTDFSDDQEVQQLLTAAQNIEEDVRELAKEAHLFTSKPDGQWEPEIWNTFSDKPRYTFDQTTPIIDQISGQIDDAEFNIKVTPVNGEASKDMAQVREGMIRNIENISEANMIYNRAGRNIVTAGIDHWLVRSVRVDDMSFDQDLVIEPIHNSIERVWIDPSSQRQDRADAEYGFLLSSVSPEKFKERWPDRAAISVDNDRSSTAYFHAPVNNVIIGNFFFAKVEKVKVVKTNLGRVFEENENFKKVKDELKKANETITDTRDAEKTTFFMRKFDGDGWLEEEKETVFSTIPLVPVYANFSVIEDKTVYHGVVQKLMDPQRVLNYSMSREIEEGALAPRAKYWMTKKQAKGHDQTLRTLNTNMDPVQFYEHDPEVPGPPQQNGGAQINPGLRMISEAMGAMMSSSAGIFAAGMGNNPNAQSGIAITQLQKKGNNVSSKFFRGLEVAICRTYDLCDKALHIVYDTERQARILESDGTFGETLLNEVVFDEQTNQSVTLNDLSKGRYSVTCKAGQSFDSRQEETVSTLIQLSAIDPSIAELGSDVLLNNVNSPGVEKIAERKRIQLLKAGVIPPNQMTEEEQQQAAIAAQEPPPPDPNMVLAQAELEKARADNSKVTLDAQIAQADVGLRQRQLSIDESKLQLEAQAQNLKIAEKSSDLNLKLRSQEFKELMAVMIEDRVALNDAVARLNKNAGTAKTIREASGADTIVGPGIPQSFKEQIDLVQSGQDQLDSEV